MKSSEYLEATAQELIENGWVQGTLITKNGSCMLGAMTNVTLKNLHDVVFSGGGTDARFFVERKVVNMGYRNIPDYNDTYGRTLNQVLDVLHECQIELKEAGL